MEIVFVNTHTCKGLPDSKAVYLGLPRRALNDEDRIRVGDLIQAALGLGLTPYTPHFLGGEGLAPSSDVWYSVAVNMLRRCDTVWAWRGWSKAEEEAAVALGKKVEWRDA